MVVQWLRLHAPNAWGPGLIPGQGPRGFPVGSVVKNLPANAGDTEDWGLIPGFGRIPGEGNGNPLQYFCLENPTDRGAWQATVHGVTKESGQDSMTKQQQQYELFPLHFLCLNSSLTKNIFGNLRHPSR